MNLLQKLYNKKIVICFYILLPIIEIITSYVVENLNISITPGMIYKTLFILYGVVFLIFLDKEYRKKNLIMLGILGIGIILHTIVTVEAFTIAALFTKATQLLKYICFPIALWFLYRYVKTGNKLDIKILVYVSAIYGTMMILAFITGTYMPTYPSKPDAGHSGWIYSGNELSTLFAMFYPIVIYYLAENKNKLCIFTAVVSTYGLLAIGTKTALLALIITLIAFALWGVLKIKENIGRNFLFIVIILVITVLVTATYFPTLTEVGVKISKAEKITENIEDENEQKEQLINSFIFNGRSEYLKEQDELWKNSGFTQQLFGLAGENKPVDANNKYTIIERDFHDLVITYGIIPTIIYFIPMITVLSEFAIRFIRNIKKEFNTYNFTLGVVIVMMLGVAYIVGHTLLVPTVTVFLALVMANLNPMEENE